MSVIKSLSPKPGRDGLLTPERQVRSSEPLYLLFTESLGALQVVDLIGFLVVGLQIVSSVRRKKQPGTSQVDPEIQQAVQVLAEDTHVSPKIPDLLPMLLAQSYCRAVDNFLAYVSSTLALIMKANPGVLKDGLKLDLAQVMQHSSIDELLEAVAEQQVLELSHRGMIRLEAEVRSRFKLSMFGRTADRDRAVEVIENRNAMVHNWGRVNRTYKKRVPWSKRQLGERVTLPTDQMASDMQFLLSCASRIDRRACIIHGQIKTWTMPALRSNVQMLRDNIALIKSKRRKAKRLSASDLTRLLHKPAQG